MKDSALYLEAVMIDFNCISGLRLRGQCNAANPPKQLYRKPVGVPPRSLSVALPYFNLWITYCQFFNVIFKI